MLCSSDERCDTASAGMIGTCRPLEPECAGHAAGESFCLGDNVRVCPDLVAYTDVPCGNHETCSDGGGTAACVCTAGYEASHGACLDVDECQTKNGGCDTLTSCQNIDGSRSCGNCPEGYTGSSEAGCVPTLTLLTISEGTLTFAPLITEYSVAVPLITETVSIIPTSALSSTIEVDGTKVASGSSWMLPKLTLGSNVFHIVVSHPTGLPKREYTLEVVRGHKESYLKASNPDASDHFGSAVAIYGDTLAVGAPDEDGDTNSESGIGAVYVFVRSNGVWAQQAILRAPYAGDHIGQSIAIDHDTLVAGAPLHSVGSATEVGAVYVFERSGATWSSASAQTRSDTPTGGDHFGQSVAIAGGTIVAGAPGLASGAAYVFVRNGSNWSQQAMLTSNPATNEFGTSVAVSADTAIVGAQDSSGTGAAFVFVRSGSSWSQQAFLKARYPDSFDEFGCSVAISGDTAVVGANLEGSAATGINGDETDNSAHGAGAVYVFGRTGTSWSQQVYIKPDQRSGAFGSSVALDGDTLVVGSNYNDSAATGVDGAAAPGATAPGSGAAYLFARNAGGWSQRALIKATNPGTNDSLYTVAVSGDTMVGGAPDEDGSSHGVDGPDNDDTTDSGAAYVVW